MQRVLGKVPVCLVFLIMSTFVLCSKGVAEESRSLETEHGEKQRLRKLEEIDEKKEIEESPTFLKSLVDKATLSGFVELNYEYVDVSDAADEDSDSTSDLFLGTVELDLRVIFNEWVKTKIVVNAEDVGKEDGIKLDEAIMKLECPWAPLYFVGGKTALPFGIFEDHMISGTLTEDLYEIDDVGATLGFAPDNYGLDISVTVYEGQNIIENLEEFGTHEFRPERKEEDDVSSFIANVTLEPVEDTLTSSICYDSEPGDGKRNQSIGGGLTLNVWKFSLDAECITALEREKGADGEENKESAWIAGLLFQPLEPLELAVRYEDFDDDRGGDQDEILDYRFLAGVNYSFLDFAIFSFEYRHSRFERERGSNAANKQDELKFQLGLEFQLHPRAGSKRGRGSFLDFQNKRVSF